MTPATCGCTPRAAGRGPRWAPTSTARLRTTSPGTRYRCPRTARAWRSAHSNDGTGTDAGHVRVYAESGGTWTQVGADIDGEAAGDQSGYSVSMSSDGTRVAIGALRTTAPARRRPRAGVRRERRDVDPGGRRHRRRGCGRPVRVLGIDVLGRHARGDRRSHERRHRHYAGHVRVYDAPLCAASADPNKDGSDGIFYCINGGTIGGSTGSCTCTSCNAGYEGVSCQTASTQSCTCTQNICSCKLPDGTLTAFWTINMKGIPYDRVRRV